jgi:uncharacterized membrane protein YdbT with pleckstrin-like domain
MSGDELQQNSPKAFTHAKQPAADARAEEAPAPEDLVPNGDASDRNTRMIGLLPEQLLQPNEIIVLLIKPSLLYVVLAGLRFIFIVLTLLTAGIWMRNNGYSLPIDKQDMVMLAMGLISLRLAWHFMEWLSRVYVLTDRRIIRVKGVIHINVFEAPLKKVQHTETQFTLRERMFGLGTITFATAGTGMAEASWYMIANPLEAHRIVVKTLDRYR